MSTRSLVAAAAFTASLAMPTLAQVRERVDETQRAGQGRASGVVTPQGYDRRDARCYDRGRDDARYDRSRDDARYDRSRDDARFDRNRGGGTHEWYDAWGSAARDRGDCNDTYSRDSRYPNRYDTRSPLARDHERLDEKLEREHEKWHSSHGWYVRNPGWERAHQALHEKLAREHERWHRSHNAPWVFRSDRYSQYGYGNSYDGRPGRATGTVRR